MVLILVKLSECMLDISVFCKEFWRNVYTTEEWSINNKSSSVHPLSDVHIVCITLPIYNNQGVTLTFSKFSLEFLLIIWSTIFLYSMCIGMSLISCKCTRIFLFLLALIFIKIKYTSLKHRTLHRLPYFHWLSKSHDC